MVARGLLLLAGALVIGCAGERPPASDARRGDRAGESQLTWPDGPRGDGRVDGPASDRRALDRDRRRPATRAIRTSLPTGASAGPGSPP